MKIKKLFLLPAIFALVSVSCEDRATSRRKEAYDNSYSQWVKLKKLNGESYEYQTTFGSWTGYGMQTVIQVRNGAVAARTCFAYQFNTETLTKDTIDSYSETGSEIGSHLAGAAPLTVDELYDTCVRKYLRVSEKENTVYFETNGDGLLNLCGYVPDGCMDDCYNGITIDTIKWIK
jgi:hypothetical protein